CKDLQDYWGKILKVIKEITNTNLSMEDVPLILLSLDIDKKGLLRDPLTLHLLYAARSIIPRHWRKTVPPSSMEWQQVVEHTRKMEEITHIIHNKSAKYWDIWEPWVRFINKSR
ncbi:hypothetical protein XELAEV_18043708mg, partial [Xenopus laevis]